MEAHHHTFPPMNLVAVVAADNLSVRDGVGNFVAAGIGFAVAVGLVAVAAAAVGVACHDS